MVWVGKTLSFQPHCHAQMCEVGLIKKTANKPLQYGCKATKTLVVEFIYPIQYNNFFYTHNEICYCIEYI